MRLWYQFGPVVKSIVIVSELVWAANLAQWRACWVFFYLFIIIFIIMYVGGHIRFMSIYVGMQHLLIQKNNLWGMEKRIVLTW